MNYKILANPVEQLAAHLKVCPKCFSKDYEETCMGFFTWSGHSHDPNERRCICGYKWYVPCPKCGKKKK